MESVAIYPGSFDPMTLGHLSVINRGLSVFDKLHVVVVHNPSKNALFTSEERVGMIRKATALLPGVEVSSLTEGLLVDRAKVLGANAILKGFRTAGDIEYELPMAHMNRNLSGLETVFLPSDPQHGYVSSSLVKEVASLGGDISGYVTPEVGALLRERLAK